MAELQSRMSDQRKPKPGDHIYMTTSDGHYHYHGIYVGDDMVIHVLGPPYREIGPSNCQKCRNKIKCNSDLIAKTCLDCFLDGRPLQFAEYGDTKPANDVVETATDLLENHGFGGRHNMAAYNTEDFAYYCKSTDWGWTLYMICQDGDQFANEFDYLFANLNEHNELCVMLVYVYEN
ncbi:hypothetical protein PTKIN_Ptkin01aG0344700 [Pterospermum kingtungense]